MSLKGPSIIRATWALFKKDLQLELRTWDTISSSLIFSLVVLLVYQFTLGVETIREIGAHRVVPGVLWLAIGFASVVGITRSMEVERQGETLTGLFRSPASRATLFLGKFLANGVKLLILELCLVALTVLFFNLPLSAITPRLALILLLGTVGLCELGTLFGAIVLRVGRGEALLATLLLPTATPLLLASIHATAEQFKPTASGDSNWLVLLFGFDLLYFFIALATFEFALEE